MKTAVSIPDAVFKLAEKEAKRRRITRSRLYSQALEQYLKAERDREITESVNRALEGQDSSVDPVMAQIQWMSLQRNGDDW